MIESRVSLALMFAIRIPAFVLAPIAGVAADRFDRKRIMLICYCGVALVMTALAALTIEGSIRAPHLLALGFLLGTCFSFSGPASTAVAANAVPDEDLSSAVSLVSVANNLTRMFGPALAAPIVQLINDDRPLLDRGRLPFTAVVEAREDLGHDRGRGSQGTRAAPAQDDFDQVIVDDVGVQLARGGQDDAVEELFVLLEVREQELVPVKAVDKAELARRTPAQFVVEVERGQHVGRFFTVGQPL